jgi:hypothetical protein
LSDIGKIIRGLLRARMEVAIVTIPEDGSECGVRLLSDSEISEANADAFAEIAKQCKARDVDVSKFLDANPDGFNRAQIHQMTFRAFRDPKSHGEPLFPSIDTIRSLDASMINALWNTYLDHQDRKAPAKVVQEDEIAAAVAAMVDDPELEYALAQMDAATLVRVSRYMLRLARKAPKETEG